MSRVRSATDAWQTILASELMALDLGLANAINATDGGAYAPTNPDNNPLQIGGAGVFFSENALAPLVLARGGILFTTPDTSALAAPTITCGDNDYPVLDPSNVLNVQQVLLSTATARGLPQFTWTVRRETGALQAYSPIFDPSDGNGPRPSRCYVPLRAHDGATFSSVVLSFRVPTAHTSVPSTMPSARVLRMDAFGNCVPMTSQAAGADANGFVYVPTPSSGAAWTNNSATQTLTIPCDQNNLVSFANYDYFVELVEEQGLTGYPWSLVYTTPVLVATTGSNIALFGLQTIDGVAVGVGDTVLVKDQTDPRNNGIFLVQAGGWDRAANLNAASQFSQGMVIPVASCGASNSNTFWQVQSSISSWTPLQTALTFVPKTDAFLPAEGSGFFGHGTLWQSMLATFSAIPDLRPQ